MRAIILSAFLICSGGTFAKSNDIVDLCEKGASSGLEFLNDRLDGLGRDKVVEDIAKILGKKVSREEISEEEAGVRMALGLNLISKAFSEPLPKYINEDDYSRYRFKSDYKEKLKQLCLKKISHVFE